MDSLNQQAPGNSSAQPQGINKPLVFALVLLTAVIAGIGGYWLGARKATNPTTEKITQTTGLNTGGSGSGGSGNTFMPSSSPFPTYPTANWKQYESQAGQFSFMYPPYYTPHENAFYNGESFVPAKNTIDLVDGNTNDIASDLPYDIKIFFERVPNGMSLNEYIDKHSHCLAKTSGIQKRPLTGLSNGMIFENTNMSCPQDGNVTIYLINTDMVYTITTQSISADVDAGERSYLNTFLSTVQFTTP